MENDLGIFTDSKTKSSDFIHFGLGFYYMLPAND